MYCTNCGSQIDNRANFCNNCGRKVEPAFRNSYQNTNNSPTPNYGPTPKAQYSIYEIFDNSNSFSAKAIKLTNSFFNKCMDKITGDPNAKYNTNSPISIPKFVITDKSIIINGIEYPFEQMTVLYPTGGFDLDIFRMFSKDTSILYGVTENQINGKTYSYNYARKEELRFFHTAMKANEKIKVSSCRQELQRILTMHAFLFEAHNFIKKNPNITFDKSQTFNEIAVPLFKDKIIVSKDMLISEFERRLISDYTYIQTKLNNLFKETNIMPNEEIEPHSNLRSPRMISSMVELMTDDDDTENAIKKYKKKRKEEEERERARDMARAERERQRMESGYYDESSSGNNSSLLGDVAKIGFGVALGRSSKKEMKKQTKLMEEQAKRERERDRQAQREADRRKRETNYRRSQIIEENQRRSRKGLPQIPVPPGDWS